MIIKTTRKQNLRGAKSLPPWMLELLVSAALLSPFTAGEMAFRFLQGLSASSVGSLYEIVLVSCEANSHHLTSAYEEERNKLKWLLYRSLEFLLDSLKPR